MALGAVQTISSPATIPSYAAPAATETFIPGDNCFLHVKNGNGSACVVTFTDPGLTPAGSAATNPTVSVAASTGDKMIPVHPSLASPSTGLVTATFSVQTSVLAAVIRR